ncbi:MAG: FtsH protease activity modulator HflK [Gammaproteobacteria bacterium]|nr:FtsH protease activity modulator HflK [Gammaproteobacteria bacterium]
MAWNEPGGNGDKDPWGSNRGNRGDQGPPDLDEVFKKLQKKFGSLFGGNGGKNNSNRGGAGAAGGGLGIGVVVAILVIFWAATGFYKIEAGERGVILQFGKHVDTTQSGLHWHLPIPIEKVIKVDITKVHTVPLRATMLTQDENIVDLEGSVQYQVADATSYLFSTRSPELSLTQATESAIRQSIGRTKMDYIITEGRGQIAVQVKGLIQNIVDSYGTGMHVIKVNIQHARPPEEVKDAFDDVTQSREDEERLKNEAETYSNGVIPKSRGAAARIREEAGAYKSAVVANAEGEAERFTKLLVAYKKAPEVTRERLYLDMMESVLNNSSKVMVDVSGSNNLLYLPLDKLMSKGTAEDVLSTSLKDVQQRELLNKQSQLRQQRTRVNNLRGRGNE